MRTDSSVNYCIFHQKARQRSAIGHVTAFGAGCYVLICGVFISMIQKLTYESVRMGRLVWLSTPRVGLYLLVVDVNVESHSGRPTLGCIPRVLSLFGLEEVVNLV